MEATKLAERKTVSQMFPAGSGDFFTMTAAEQRKLFLNLNPWPSLELRGKPVLGPSI